VVASPSPELTRRSLAFDPPIGLKRQDNDLIVIESAEAAAAFKQTFEARFASAALTVPPAAPVIGFEFFVHDAVMFLPR
jgi:hypothetical protein